jgi:hypothetical protein
MRKQMVLKKRKEDGGRLSQDLLTPLGLKSGQLRVSRVRCIPDAVHVSQRPGILYISTPTMMAPVYEESSKG